MAGAAPGFESGCCLMLGPCPALPLTALTWNKKLAVGNLVGFLCENSNMALEGKSESFCRRVIGCGYLCFPLKGEPLFPSTVQVQRISGSGPLWNFYLARVAESLLVNPQDTGEELVTSRVPLLCNLSFLSLPLGLTIKKKRKKNSHSTFRKSRAGFLYVLETVLIHFPLYSYWSRKREKIDSQC